MTQSEKTTALGFVLLTSVIAVVTHNWRGSNLLLTLGFAAALYVITFWFGRALSARWDDQNQPDEIVCTKPTIFRLFYGFFALAMLIAGVSCFLKSPSVGEKVVNLSFFGFVSLLILTQISYYRLCLNLVTRQYTLTRGFPTLRRVVSGSFDGSTVLAMKNNKGASQVRFRPNGSRWGFPMLCCLPSQEVSEQAYRIADKLGLSVEQRG